MKQDDKEYISNYFKRNMDLENIGDRATALTYMEYLMNKGKLPVTKQLKADTREQMILLLIDVKKMIDRGVWR